MRILIDGYNLLNSTDVPARGFGIGSLERSRLGLLHFLVETLDPQEVAHTLIVFDGRGAPPGLPKAYEHHGLSVRFALRHETADDLLEELIAADPAPRQLTVVSSDHRIQRAARRRKARAVDSAAWHDEIRHRRRRPVVAAPRPAKPATPLLEAEVAAWLERFGGEAAAQQAVVDEAHRVDKPTPADNPFPPGYAEDILADDVP